MAWTTSADRMRSVVCFAAGGRERISMIGKQKPLRFERSQPVRNSTASDEPAAATPAVRLAIVALALAAVLAGGVDTNLAMAACGGLIAGFALTQLPSKRGTARHHMTEQQQKRSAISPQTETTPERRGSLQPPMSPSPRLPDRASNYDRPGSDVQPRSIAELTARMSHDLRTPLNAVIGFSDLMKQEVYGPIGHDRYREYASHIEQSGQALLAATEDALAVTTLMARPANRANTTLDLIDLVRGLGVEINDDGAKDSSEQRPKETRIAVRGERTALSQAISRAIALVRDRRSNSAETVAHLLVRGEAVTLIFKVGSTGEPVPDAVTQAQATRRAFPRPQDDIGYCLAHALCELQGIDLKLFEGAQSCTVCMTMERAETQASLFEMA